MNPIHIATNVNNIAELLLDALYCRGKLKKIKEMIFLNVIKR